MQASGQIEPWLAAGPADPRVRRGGIESCEKTRMSDSPVPTDLTSLAAKYGIAPNVAEDLYARRRAGARDAELVNLLTQQDRGGLEPEHARALVAELPAR
jgi:hypothetical protein